MAVLTNTLRKTRTRNSIIEQGTLTCTAADTLPTSIGTIEYASAVNTVTGVAVAATWSGNTLTVGSGPASTVVAFFITGY